MLARQTMAPSHGRGEQRGPPYPLAPGQQPLPAATLLECPMPTCPQTNVAGIYTRPPGQPGAQLLSRIEVCTDGSWRATTAGGGALEQAEVQTSTSGHDTTGGIQAKIDEAAGIVAAAAAAGGGPGEVRIAQAGTPHALAACRAGPLPEGWVGTVVVSSNKG